MTTKAEILEGLNEQQKDVVVDYNGMISLEAIPGSGKTHTLVSRIQYMIKDGIRPSRILAFTFTKKAANELKERVRAAIGPDADKISISTYHSFCGRILRLFPGYSGRNANFSIYDEEDKMSVLGDIVKKFTQAPRAGIVANYISSFKMRGLSPSEATNINHPNGYSRTSAMVYAVYEKAMCELNAFDFDDLPFWAYRIVKNDKDVLDHVSNMFDYVLSDENQDANKQNLDFIMLLGQRTKNILVVGDTDQSIYAFRGADVNNVMNTYRKCHFDMRYLSTNYRSTETIVRAADNVIGHNRKRISKDSETINETGRKIKVVECPDQPSEALFVVRRIKQLMEKDPNLRYKDFAILSRMTSQAGPFERVFLRENVPYRIKGSTSFCAREEVKDIMAFLRFAINTSDLIAFSRVFNVPKRGLGKTSLDKCLLKRQLFDDIINDEDNSVKNLDLGTKATKAAEEFFGIIRNIRNRVDTKVTVAEIIEKLIEETDYDDYLYDKYHEKEDDDGSLYYRKKRNLEDLIGLARSYGTDFIGFVGANVLEDTSIFDSSIDEAENDNFVNVMTIHGAKGLEFDTVFVIGCTNSSLPHFRSSSTPEGIEEERRLFYVAMTRAKKNLYLTYPVLTSNPRTGEHLEEPSIFLHEIPDEYKTSNVKN